MKKEKLSANRVLTAIQSNQWAISETGLQNILAIADRENDIEAVLAKRGELLDNTRSVEIRDGVAVVPVHGPIFRYANLFTEISGATSIQVLSTEIRKAVEADAIDAIVLDIDSPGGEASGTSELAGLIREAAQTKPITAYIGTMAASAAYWLASAATRVVMEKTAHVGSIGVVTSGYKSRKTNIVEIVSSQSPYKRVAIDSNEGRARAQSMVDKMAQIFIETVADYRGVSVEKVLADFGQGDIVIASDAIAAGMADEIGTLEATIAGFAGNGTTFKIYGVNNMSTTDKTPAIETRSDLKSVNPTLLESIESAAKEAGRAEAHAEGVAAGVAQETARIKAVEDQLIAGHEDLIAELKFDGKTTGPEAAVQVLAAEKAAGAAALDKQASDSPEPVEPSVDADADPQASNDDGLTDEERWEAEYKRDDKLKAEFSDVDQYKAFKSAEASGHAKVFGK